MLKQTRFTNFTLEQTIIHHLMMKSTFINDFGLLYGKMGISLFFYEYSKFKNEITYREFAKELLESICNIIHKRIPIEFNSGLSGIAWGLEYLIQNHFIRRKSNDICNEIDQYIMRTDIKRIINNEFLKEDLENFLHYILARISGSWKQNKSFPFDSLYIDDLYSNLSILQKEKNISINTQSLIKSFFLCIEQKNIIDYNFDISLFINKKNIKKNIYSCEFGLKKGLAGYLLHQTKIVDL